MVVVRAGSRAGVLALLLAVIGITSCRGAYADVRIDAVARSLRLSSVYVSPALERVVLPADVTALRNAARRYGHPVFVAALPTFGSELDAPTVEDWPDVLHDRIGRPGLYLVADGEGALAAVAFDVSTRFDPARLETAVEDDQPDQRVGQQLAYAMRLLSTGKRESRRPRDVTALVWLAAVVGALLGVGLVFGRPLTRALIARRARVPSGRPPRATGEIEPVATRREARAALAGLSAALAGVSAPPEAAFDCYAAASKVLGEARPSPIDLLGGLTLCERGTMLLSGRDARRCFFDPRHGAGSAETRWRVGGEDVSIPACPACAKAVARGRAPAAALDHGHPYYERDTVWGRTGLGSVDDDLPALVLTGAARA